MQKQGVQERRAAQNIAVWFFLHSLSACSLLWDNNQGKALWLRPVRRALKTRHHEVHAIFLSAFTHDAGLLRHACVDAPRSWLG